jgi:chromosome segregation ATPase
MPKLSKIRLTHISYNQDHNRINNEILDLRSQSTLIKLANGGGKSVLTQMLLAPYITPRKRNFKDRKFADYFASIKPSFILQEWQLDSNGGYICVGLMVRKSRKHIEDEAMMDASTRLDQYAFIAEYSSCSSPISLENLPILDYNPANRMPTIPSFDSAQKKLQTLAGEHKNHFFLYNLNNSAHMATYVKKLAEYGLERGQFDQLVAFNQDESGLSMFCTTYNTEDKLVRRVFLPAIEEKLDRMANVKNADKEGHVYSLRKNMISYATMQKENKERYEYKDLQKQLLADMQNLLPKAEFYTKNQQTIVQMQNGMQAFYQGARKKEANLNTDEQSLQAQTEASKKELDQLQYEMYSQNYYVQKQKQDDVVLLLREQEAKYAEGLRLEKQKQYEFNALRLASIYNQLKNFENKSVLLQEQLETAKKSSEQIYTQLCSYGSGLYAAYSLLQEKLDAQKESLESRNLALIQEQKEQKEKAAALQKEKESQLKEQSKLNIRLSDFENKEHAFEKKYDYLFSHTLDFYNDLPIYEKACAQFLEELETSQEDLQTQKEALASLEQKQNQTAADMQDLSLKQTELKGEQKLNQQLLEQQEKIIENRKVLLKRLNLGEDKLWDEQAILHAIELEENRCLQAIEASLAYQQQLRNQIASLKRGNSLPLNDQMKEILEKLNITPITGVEWVRSLKNMNIPQKESMIKKHPFLPYALVMTQSQIESFLKALKEAQITTEAPLPLIDRDALSQNHAPNLSLDEVRFYTGFNMQLIQPKKLQELLDQMDKRYKDEVSQMSLLQSEQQKLSRLSSSFVQDALDQKSYESTRKKEADLKEELIQIQKQLTLLKSELESLKKQIRTQKEQVSFYEKALQKASFKLQESKQLMQDYMQAQKNFELQIQISQKLSQIEKEQQSLTQAADTISANLLELKEKLVSNKLDRQQNQKQLESYSLYSDYAPASGTLEELLSRYEGSKKKLDETMVNEYEAQLQEVKKQITVLNTSLAASQASFGLQKEDYMHLQSSTVAEIEAENALKAIQEQNKENLSKQGVIKQNLGKIEGKIDSILEQIYALNQQKEPLAKNQIRQQDLKPLMQAQKQLQKELKAQISQVQSQISKLKGLLERMKEIVRTFNLPADESEEIFDCKALSVAQITDQWQEAKNALDSEKDRLSFKKKELDDILSRLVDTYEQNDESTTQMLIQLKKQTAKPDLFEQSLQQDCQLLEQYIAQAEADLANVEKSKEELNLLLHAYVMNIHEQMNLIDKKTTITLGDNRKKMLHIHTADALKNPDLYKVKVRDFVDSIIERVWQNPADLERFFSYWFLY